MANDETNFGKVGADEIRLGNADIIESELEQLDQVTPGQAAPLKALVADANSEVQGVGIGHKTGTAAVDGAIAQKTGSVHITKAGVAVLTIADPVAVTDDGKRLRIIADTAFAHTVSNAAGSGFNAGGAASDVATFGGARGDNFEVEAYGGKWYVLNLRNVVLG